MISPMEVRRAKGEIAGHRALGPDDWYVEQWDICLTTSTDITARRFFSADGGATEVYGWNPETHVWVNGWPIGPPNTRADREVHVESSRPLHLPSLIDPDEVEDWMLLDPWVEFIHAPDGQNKPDQSERLRLQAIISSAESEMYGVLCDLDEVYGKPSAAPEEVRAHAGSLHWWDFTREEDRSWAEEIFLDPKGLYSLSPPKGDGGEWGLDSGYVLSAGETVVVDVRIPVRRLTQVMSKWFHHVEQHM